MPPTALPTALPTAPHPPDAAAAQVARLLADVAAHAGPADLRWLVAAYEGAQRERVALGEQLRAVLQGRAGGAPPCSPPSWSAPLRGPCAPCADPPCADPRCADPRCAAPPRAEVEALLAQLRAGTTAGPDPTLATLYRRMWQEERAVGAAMEAVVGGHPAWPWLAQVRGVGRTLSARLLARLDVRRAAHPSSFWRYCGLATVEGPVEGPAAGARRAQPRARRGERRPYDAHARALCHLIGMSILRRGGAYKAYYRASRAWLDDAHPDWPAGRRHLTALRRVEKRFLAHLWIVWREREDLPVGAPHADAVDATATPFASPWDMTG